MDYVFLLSLSLLTFPGSQGSVLHMSWLWWWRNAFAIFCGLCFQLTSLGSDKAGSSSIRMSSLRVQNTYGPKEQPHLFFWRFLTARWGASCNKVEQALLLVYFIDGYCGIYQMNFVAAQWQIAWTDQKLCLLSWSYHFLIVFTSSNLRYTCLHARAGTAGFFSSWKIAHVLRVCTEYRVVLGSKGDTTS